MILNQIIYTIWVCLKIGNTPRPNGFADHYPYEKWLFHWEYTLFSDKHFDVIQNCYKGLRNLLFLCCRCVWIVSNQASTGWWFGTCFIFPYIWKIATPTDELIFFRGVETYHQPVNLLESDKDVLYPPHCLLQ